MYERGSSKSGRFAAGPCLLRGGFMSGNLLTRRGALVGLGAFAAAGLAGCNTTPSAGVQPVATSGGGAIEVDTTPLVAYVGNPTAGWVQQALPGALAQVLGSRAPEGPSRPDRHALSRRRRTGRSRPDDGRRDWRPEGQSTCDAISTYISNPTDQALPEQALQGRVQALCVAFAYRLKRKLGA